LWRVIIPYLCHFSSLSTKQHEWRKLCWKVEKHYEKKGRNEEKKICEQKKENKWEESVLVEDEMRKKPQVPHSRFANLQPIQIGFPSSFPNYDSNKWIEESLHRLV